MQLDLWPVALYTVTLNLYLYSTGPAVCKMLKCTHATTAIIHFLWNQKAQNNKHFYVTITVNFTNLLDKLLELTTYYHPLISNYSSCFSRDIIVPWHNME